MAENVIVSTRPLVLKFGGELLEDRAHLATVVSAIATLANTAPLVVVHGGGREIDAALKIAGIETRQVDGLRITDDATLDVVVSVLAGAVNTRFVAALNAAGVAADTRLLTTLISDRFVPIVACIGIGRDGRLFNVNADTFAGHLAARLLARRLVIAGTTPGVLAADGSTLTLLEAPAVARLVNDGTATAGMIAKLRACEHALAGGVEDVVIVDGRDRLALEAAATAAAPASATRLIRMVPA